MIPALVLVGGLGLAFLLFYMPSVVRKELGPGGEHLSLPQRWIKSAQLYPKIGQITHPAGRDRRGVSFEIQQGESVYQITERLEAMGLIGDGDAWRNYLVYSGLDTSIQAGRYELNSGMNGLEIAYMLQDATPGEVRFVILPGWRLEEIALALSVSGLEANPEDFLAGAHQGLAEGINARIPSGDLEGFLLPDQYILPRDASVRNLLGLFTSNFSLKVTDTLLGRYADHGLDLRQAVTLASIVQREAMFAEEQPTIASVFFNRLAAGMRLESDPTVQYAVGKVQGTDGWWKNPLTVSDLKTDSPYNTYQYPGIPPGPISNPSLSALRAVAYPAETPYYFFRAACDDSGRHEFSKTYEEHLAKGCQ